MITTTQMYWLVILDSIQGGALVMATLSGVVGLLSSIGAALDEMPRWIAKISIGTFLASMLILMFTPSTKQMAAIIVVPKIANSEKVQQAGNRLYDLAVEWMDALKPKTNKDQK